MPDGPLAGSVQVQRQIFFVFIVVFESVQPVQNIFLVEYDEALQDGL